MKTSTRRLQHPRTPRLPLARAAKLRHLPRLLLKQLHKDRPMHQHQPRHQPRHRPKHPRPHLNQLHNRPTPPRVVLQRESQRHQRLPLFGQTAGCPSHQ